MFVALAVVTGLSALVGWQGANKPQQFDWGLAATFGTAFGTTALASGTVVLAWLTKRSVGTGEELVAQTERSVDAATRLVEETKRSVDLAAEQVAATKQSIEVATRDLETTIRPVLADVPLGEFTRQRDPRVHSRFEDLAQIRVVPNRGQAGSTCSVPMRNVGTGIAILGDAKVQLPPDTNWHDGEPTMRIVPLEEDRALRLSSGHYSRESFLRRGSLH